MVPYNILYGTIYFDPHWMPYTRYTLPYIFSFLYGAIYVSSIIWYHIKNYLTTDEISQKEEIPYKKYMAPYEHTFSRLCHTTTFHTIYFLLYGAIQTVCMVPYIIFY